MGSSNTSQNVETQDKQDFLSKVEKVEKTPFSIVEENGEYFGVLGNHRLTPIYKYKKDCKWDLEEITWDRLVQVIWVVTEKIKEKEEIYKIVNELNKEK